MSSWAVVLPVKPWATAKSRLTSDPAIRADLARAFALDVIAATRSTPGVAGIVVVTSEPTLSVLLSAPVPARHGGGSGQLAEVVVVDDPGGSLDESVLHGAGRATRHWPGLGTAVVTSDLPALTPAQLGAVLAAAAVHDRSAVADAEGTGTTVLTAGTGHDIRPAFGAGSFERHRRLGAADLTSVAAPGVRRDVDLAAHLVTARRLGVGVHTQAVRDLLTSA
ncbi:MAG TPA: 2-phospho-L-lactate guanylyltransferase [Nocardioidaceae bacterium]|jgi:2-phospho-L-lactate guanylyltransferase|nr:2-phospho-L-lactate guanylyltransferase [Nocardioidaceae bacterium]